jgi:tetratricopeptide (TPR) repeat protein
LGLSKSAVVCFRLSLRQSPTLPDTLVKLAALLNDMDDPKGAHVLFGRASTLLASRGSGSGSGSGVGAERERGQIFCLLHMAELAANQSDFDEAVSLLGQAKRLNDSLSGFEAAAIKAKAKAKAMAEAETEVNDASSRQAQRLRLKHYSQVHFTILTLLGVTLFRLSPTSPECCLGVLRPAVAEAKAQRRAHKRRQRRFERQHDSSEQPSAAIHNYPDPPHGTVGHVYLLLCMGEVLAQCGDLSGSLNLFRQASRLYPQHPLPFINAARSYQQLNQRTLAAQHLARAIELDPLFPLPHIDAAQSLLYQGKVEACSEALERALTLARHGKLFFY